MEQVACPDCDLLHAAVSLEQGEEARCTRCGTPLPLPRALGVPHLSVAILATALVAFSIAISTPLMSMSGAGHTAEVTLPASAIGMWLAGSPVAAIAVALLTIVLPATYLALALAAGAGALRSPAPRWSAVAARYARAVMPWAMPEVMLLATLVSYVKIAQLADASPGLGMYATGALAVLLVLGRDAVHLPTLWSRVPRREATP